METAFRICYSVSSELFNGVTESFYGCFVFPLGKTEGGLVTSMNKKGREGFSGLVQNFKTSQKHRGLKKKFFFAKKDSTTPENTVVVAPDNPEVNFVAIYIRL